MEVRMKELKPAETDLMVEISMRQLQLEDDQKLPDHRTCRSGIGEQALSSTSVPEVKI